MAFESRSKSAPERNLDKIFCTSCGTPCSRAHNFCSQCGQQLVKPPVVRDRTAAPESHRSAATPQASHRTNGDTSGYRHAMIEGEEFVLFDNVAARLRTPATATRSNPNEPIQRNPSNSGKHQRPGGVLHMLGFGITDVEKRVKKIEQTQRNIGSISSHTSLPANHTLSSSASSNPIARRNTLPTNPTTHSHSPSISSTTTSLSPSISATSTANIQTNSSATQPPASVISNTSDYMTIALQRIKFGISAALDAESRNGARRAPIDRDFTAKLTLTGLRLPGNSEPAFTFREYAPKVFHSLRDRFGIHAEDFRKSLCESDFSGLGFSGKSGSALYISPDRRFILKVVPRVETKYLRRILADYHRHMTAAASSFLIRFLASYRVMTSLTDDISVLVMSNIFCGAKEIHERYDLKGSTVGRKTLFSCTLDRDEVNQALSAGGHATKQESSVHRSSYVSKVVLKDLDLVARFRIKLGQPRKAKFMQRIQRDVDLLMGFGIIDYSLLLGVHFIKPEEASSIGSLATLPVEPLESAEGGIMATDNECRPLRAIYYCAIIDILQPYNVRKVLEHNMKSLVYDRDGISVCPPEKYAKRFVNFIERAIE